MNKVILKGNVTRNPEVKYTPKGTAVCDVGIAVNKVWYDDQQQKREEVTFVDVRFWGRHAETVGKHFNKGRPILIEGELRQEEWEDKETGKPRRKTLVVASGFEFCGEVRGGGDERRESQGGDAARPYRESAERKEPWRPNVPQAPARPAEGGMETDDIPF